jgi:transcription antitermination factor NusA-like protein
MSRTSEFLKYLNKKFKFLTVLIIVKKKWVRIQAKSKVAVVVDGLVDPVTCVGMKGSIIHGIVQTRKGTLT